MTSLSSDFQRNPDWTRDELIVALDLYFRVDTAHTSKSDPEVIAVSETLKGLKIHAEAKKAENFRNPQSVYMKLSNFLALDPMYVGAGLSRGSKLDGVVWREFHERRAELGQFAKIIASASNSSAIPEGHEIVFDNSEEFPEGRIIESLHKTRERNKKLIRRKKEQSLQANGALACEVCNFDFEKTYGSLGRNFIECHHTKPLSELSGSSKTKLVELALVCSNCHRMIHRARPWKSVDELKHELTSRIDDSRS